MRKIVLIILFVIPFVGCCDEDLGERQDPFLLDGSAVPSALVRGVNVITGAFTWSEAAVALEVPEPLVFGLSYNSRGEKESALGHGFSHDHPTHLTRVREPEESFSQMHVDMGGGSCCHFYGKKGWLRTTYFLDPEMQKFGLTNGGGGQYHYKNWQLIHEKWPGPEFPWILNAGDGTKRYYNDHKRLEYERRPSGNTFHYAYGEDHQLNKITIRDRSGRAVLGVLDLQQSKDRWTLQTNQHRRAVLTFEKMKNGSRRLRSCRSTGRVGFSLDYSHDKLTALKQWDGRGLFLSYGSKRVHTLSTLGGCDSAPSKLFTFNYHRDSRYTTVTDALGMQRIYRYNKNLWLTDVERYWGKKYYSSQKLIWKQTGHARKGVLDRSGGGNLLAKAVQNQEGHAVSAFAYQHDDAGNVVQETIVGHLTGNEAVTPIRVDNTLGYLSGGETFSRHFRYSEEGRNLKVEESDENGLSMRYCYLPNTSLLAAQYTCCHGAIEKREFFHYDSSGFVLEKITDDGCSEDEEDLTNVTERLITKQTPFYSYVEPGFGHPKEIIEGFWDLKNQKFQQLRRVVKSYYPQGLVMTEKVYDADGAFRYSKLYDYDEWHNLTMKSDALGQVTRYRYRQKNCVYEEQKGSGFHKEFVYDRENRRIAEKWIDTLGHVDLTLCFYHPMGQCVRTVDSFGQATHYNYDPLGRCNRVIAPSFYDPDGKCHEVTKEMKYNCLDQVISETDALGNETKKDYTARGQLTLVTYPDGSRERCYYARDGSVIKKVAKDHSFVCFTYDVRRRPILEQRYDATSHLMQTIEKQYRGNRLGRMIDSWGTTTEYCYDGAGRLVAEETHTVDGMRRKTFVYDALGRQHAIQVFYGEQPNEYTVMLEEHDLLDRVIESRVEDCEGKVLRRTLYTYDRCGNVIKEKQAIQENQWSTTSTEYDTANRPISQTDAEGATTTIVYEDGFYNSQGQNVLKVTTVQPMGRQTIEIYDTQGRVALRMEKDLVGSLLTHVALFYDSKGNKTAEEHRVLVEGEETGTYRMEWKYDSCQRMQSVVEWGADRLTKETLQEYDLHGRLQTITKPDGTTLRHNYDSRGRLLGLTASDRSIDYHYTYDEQDRLTRVKDEIQNTTLEREYDAFGQLLSETLPNGLSIQYTYDLQGRSVEVVLPDETGIGYDYDALYLNTVKRLDREGNFLYSHRYTKTDLQGNTLVSEGIEGSSLLHMWDRLGRLRETRSPYWSQAISDGGFDASGNLIHQEICDFESAKDHYEYDLLDRLSTEKGTHLHTYTYDSVGNRQSKDDKMYCLNGLHQVVHDGQTAYRYDCQGNLLCQDGFEGRISYRYDALNRLIQVEGPAWSLSYTYDSFGRRLTRRVVEESVQEEAFLYQGEREIGSYSPEGKQIAIRLLGRGRKAELGAAVAIELGQELFLPIHNHRGDLCCLVDVETQKVAQWMRYTTFGEVTCYGQSGDKCQEGLSPWLVSSKRLDPLTGFVHFGHRDYDPRLGRWVTPDPAGFGDGPNLYQYSNNNPLIFVDPDGLWLSTLSNVFQATRFCSTVLSGGLMETVCSAAGIAIEQLARHLLPKNSFTRYGLELFGSVLQGGYFIPEFAGLIEPLSGLIEGSDLPNAIVRVTTGIMTGAKECKAFASHVHELLGGQFKVHWSCNPSSGFVSDILSAGWNLIGGETQGSTFLERALFNDYRQLLGEGDNGVIYLIAHSRGAVEAASACKNLGSRVGRTIKLFTIGSAKLIRETGIGQVINYVNDNDLIPRLDLINFYGKTKGLNIVYTGYKSQSLAIGIADHFLGSQGYRQATAMITAQILNEQKVKK